MELGKPEDNRAYQQMLQAARKRLEGRDGGDIAVKSGAVFLPRENCLAVKSLQETITVSLTDFTTQPALDQWHHLLLLHYLDLADGVAEPEGLLTFGDLKAGLIRGTKFDRTAERELEQILWNQTPEVVRSACERLDGEFPETNGDLCVIFRLFPNYPLILKVWFADEEFPASGKLLLRSNADHYLTVEDAVTAGEILLQKLSAELNGAGRF